MVIVMPVPPLIQCGKKKKKSSHSNKQTSINKERTIIKTSN